jgi:hypothetical protein
MSKIFDDPLKNSPPMEMRQLTFVQRRDLKGLVERVLDHKAGWSYDQRSVFAEMDTTVPDWSLTNKQGSITMKAVLQVVMRPHLVGNQPRGLKLYHRRLRKQLETNLPKTKQADNTELEKDGVVEELNKDENKGLSTEWFCTVWMKSDLAKKLVDLVNSVSSLPNMEKEEKTVKEKPVRPFRRSPF